MNAPSAELLKNLHLETSWPALNFQSEVEGIRNFVFILPNKLLIFPPEIIVII